MMNGMEQRKSSDRSIHNEQGVALIYALVVMAVILALSLTLLYGIGQVSLMTSSYRDQDDCYLQALTLSEVIDAQIVTGSSIYQAAVDYMPEVDSELMVDSMRYQADTPDRYGNVAIRFQNGVESITSAEPPDWQRQQLSNQYLDLTVEVFGQKGGKESVTTRYRFYQKLDDTDMEYTLKIIEQNGTEHSYDNVVYNRDGDCFEYTDQDITDKKFTINGQPVKMEHAQLWNGTVQDGGTQVIRMEEIDSDGNPYMADITLNHTKVQLTRIRKILGSENERSEILNGYTGTELKFEKVNTR